jgi:hypothetical protein
VIAGLAPKTGISNKFPLILSEKAKTPRIVACICGNLSSIAFDFVARQKIGSTTLNYFYLKQFPVLPPKRFGGDEIDFIVPKVLELIYTSETMRSFAEDLGYKGSPFRWDPDRRAYLKAELDAYYARLYGLTRDELRYILDPADVKGEDYPSETFRVLKNNEIRKFGEYRTARLVLQAWDKQEECKDD